MSKLDRLERLAEYLIEGPFHWMFRSVTGAVSAPASQAAPSATGRPPEETRELMAISSARTAARWRLELGDRRFRLGEPVVTIGRAPDNDITLSDLSVSQHHAQLRWRNGRYYLHLVSPMSGPPAPLTSGDEIRLGQVILRVVVES